MLEIKNTQIYGLEKSTYVAGYPMQVEEPKNDFEFNEKRASKLGSVQPGTGHDTFLSGIIVQCDIKFSLYWLKQFQRYHWCQIISSQSTMHRIKNMSIKDICNKYIDERIIRVCEQCQKEYLDALEKYPNDKERHYFYFMRLISNLPSGIEMWMGISTNYQQLKTIYFQRKNHKLKEDWGYFCEWIENLPYFKEFCVKN